MPKVLNILESSSIVIVGELEQIAYRLAKELGIRLIETSQSAHDLEVIGENKNLSLSYFRESDGYECIETEKRGNTLNIINAEGNFSVYLKADGKKLRLAIKKSRKTSMENRLDAAIIMERGIKADPEKEYEITIRINSEDLDTISGVMINKYLS